MKYAFFIALAILLIIRVALFFVDWLAHKIGLIKLMILERYCKGEITDEELKQHRKEG